MKLPPPNAEVVRINRAGRILFRGRAPAYMQTDATWSEEHNYEDTYDYPELYALASTELDIPSTITVDFSLTTSQLPPAQPDELPQPGTPDGPPLPAGVTPPPDVGGGEDPPGTEDPDYPYVPPEPPAPLPEPIADSYESVLAGMLGYRDRRPDPVLAFSAHPWRGHPPPLHAVGWHPRGAADLVPQSGPTLTPRQKGGGYDTGDGTKWGDYAYPLGVPDMPPEDGTERPAGNLSGPDYDHVIDLQPSVPMLMNPWWIAVFELGGLHLKLMGDTPLIDRTGATNNGYAVPGSGVSVGTGAARTGSTLDEGSTVFDGTDGRIVTPYKFPAAAKPMGPRGLIGRANGNYVNPAHGENDILPSDVNPAWPSEYRHPGFEPTLTTWAARPYFEAKGGYWQLTNISFWARREAVAHNNVLLTGTGGDRWRLYAPGETHPFLSPRDLCLEVNASNLGAGVDGGGAAFPSDCTFWYGVLPDVGEWFHVMITNACQAGIPGRDPWRSPGDGGNSPVHLLQDWWGSFLWDYTDNAGDFPPSGGWNLFINGKFKGRRSGNMSDATQYTLGAHGLFDLFARTYPRRLDALGMPILSDPGPDESSRYPFWGNLVLGSDSYVDPSPWGDIVPGGLAYYSWHGELAHLAAHTIGFDELVGDDNAPTPYGHPDGSGWFINPWGAASYAFLCPNGYYLPWDEPDSPHRAPPRYTNLAAFQYLYDRFDLASLAATDT